MTPVAPIRTALELDAADVFGHLERFVHPTNTRTVTGYEDATCPLCRAGICRQRFVPGITTAVVHGIIAH